MATTRGVVLANDVVVATNAYVDGLVPPLERRVLPPLARGGAEHHPLDAPPGGGDALPKNIAATLRKPADPATLVGFAEIAVKRNGAVLQRGGSAADRARLLARG